MIVSVPSAFSLGGGDRGQHGATALLLEHFGDRRIDEDVRSALRQHNGRRRRAKAAARQAVAREIETGHAAMGQIVDSDNMETTGMNIQKNRLSRVEKRVSEIILGV